MIGVPVLEIEFFLKWKNSGVIKFYSDPFAERFTLNAYALFVVDFFSNNSKYSYNIFRLYKMYKITDFSS